MRVLLPIIDGDVRLFCNVTKLMIVFFIYRERGFHERETRSVVLPLAT